MTFKTSIIPTKPTFIGEPKTLDYKSICVFAALGFFLDDDTYYTEQKALRAATQYQIENAKIISQQPYFKWYYNPSDRPLKQIVQEFAQLFEQIVDEQTAKQKVILPLSGGLDSRTQAAALRYLKKDVQAYSYMFQGGHNETLYAKKIAQVCGFPFQAWEVPKGYLWHVIDDLAKINGCYTEFTHPRQMAFSGKYQDLGDEFNLGHWGDVLFDDMGVPDDLPLESQTEVLFKKVVKKGGMELATALWKQWDLEGDFYDYLYERLKFLLYNVNIPKSANAQIRAFKSLYWAPRWTSVNLSVFENECPIRLPYYDDRMCEFICSVPEKYLRGRQIQIEYLKMRHPELAAITWQSQKPFNLYNYQYNKVPYNLLYRAWHKVKRSLSTTPYIQRNWELQFVGTENEKQLEARLFDNKRMEEFISKDLTESFYEKFKSEDAVYYSHPVSMLLTLSQFFKQT
jgi:hypothetical protein